MNPVSLFDPPTLEEVSKEEQIEALRTLVASQEILISVQLERIALLEQLITELDQKFNRVERLGQKYYNDIKLCEIEVDKTTRILEHIYLKSDATTQKWINELVYTAQK